jgi:clan AA aspartic protease
MICLVTRDTFETKYLAVSRPIRIADSEVTCLSAHGSLGKLWLDMGLTHVTVRLRNLAAANGSYEADFLVDTGATDSLAPRAELQQIGLKAVGKTVYELAKGAIEEYEYGLAEITFMGEVTAGRIIFGPDDAEPLLGVTALESVGITIDPANRTLKRLPAIPLK